MSLPKRPINVDPNTSLRDASDLIQSAEDELKFRVGAQLYVIHRSEEEVDTDKPGPIAERKSGADGLLAITGIWKGLIDGDEFKRYIYEMRDSDRDRPLVEFP